MPILRAPDQAAATQIALEEALFATTSTNVNYTFLATDLMTNQVLGELPVSQVQLDAQLNTAGNMSCAANLSDPKIDSQDLLSRTIPGRTAFWAYRENQIVWGGIIWTRVYTSQGRSLNLTGQTFESYAARRFPRSWLGAASTAYNQGQMSIINDLWHQLQAVSFGNIGVLPFESFPASDTVRQITVNGFDLSKNVDGYIQDITGFSDGPDYTITCTEDGNGLPLKQLLLGAPLGRSLGAATLSFDFPGAALDYVYAENAANGATQWWAQGDGSGTATVTGVATDLAALSGGFPLIESSDQFNGTTLQSVINQHAADSLAISPVPKVTHSVDLVGILPPQFGEYSLGDYIVVNVVDSRFPSGQQFPVRVIGWTINPPDAGNGVETISLVFYEPDVPAGAG